MLCAKVACAGNMRRLYAQVVCAGCMRRLYAQVAYCMCAGCVLHVRRLRVACAQQVESAQACVLGRRNASVGRVRCVTYVIPKGVILFYDRLNTLKHPQTNKRKLLKFLFWYEIE